MVDVIYSFGDSYTTTSNINSSTGTYAGGQNWLLKFRLEAERLQDPSPVNDEKAKLLFNTNTRKIKLCNYARSGDVLSRRHVVGEQEGRGSVMEDQWEMFLADCEAERAVGGGTGGGDGAENDRRLFVVWIGINDVCEEGVGDTESYLERLFTSYKYFIMHDLYSHAEAGNIMILKLPPLERTPTELGIWKAKMKASGGIGGVGNHTNGVSKREETDLDFAAMIDSFNRRLEKMVEEVQNETIGLTFHLIDTHAIFTTVLDNPQRFGFVDGVSACKSMQANCVTKANTTAPPRCHVWADGYHPTREMQIIVGEEVFREYLNMWRRREVGC